MADPAQTTTARSLLAQGDAAFKRGQWRAAMQAFGGVVRAVPAHFRARFRVADALLNTGRRDLAVEVYQAVALQAMSAGHPLLALVATKMLLLLEPSTEEVPLALAELYAKDGERISGLIDAPPLVAAEEEPASPLTEEGDALLSAAAALAAGGHGSLPAPAQLPAIPLLSFLEEDAFLEVLQKLRLRRFADEEVVIREGEHGESFFMVADGDVLVKRDIDDDDGGVTLAHLHRGSVFGEMALISDEPRQASVVAKGDVDVLEMRRSDLVVAAAQVEGVSEALKAFTRERFLRNLTATHAFFSGLSRDERHGVMESFRVVTFSAGQELIREGVHGPGLFLLLGGSASVSKQASGERVHLATLKGGDVCGEISLLGDQPTVATVTADEDLESLFLHHDSFKEVVRRHPEVMKYLAGLTDERLRQNRALLHGRGLFEDDEHVMI
jgi:cAMP-dependent protein kinase regulator